MADRQSPEYQGHEVPGDQADETQVTGRRESDPPTEAARSGAPPAGADDWQSEEEEDRPLG
jgi:hypothetical protein